MVRIAASTAEVQAVLVPINYKYPRYRGTCNQSPCYQFPVSLLFSIPCQCAAKESSKNTAMLCTTAKLCIPCLPEIYLKLLS